MMVVTSAGDAETALKAGEMACPACTGQLRPHGHGRTRTVRGMGITRLTVRPRRVRCIACGATHVLLPAALYARLADATEVIGSALAAKAAGDGHRTRSPPAWGDRCQRCGVGCGGYQPPMPGG